MTSRVPLMKEFAVTRTVGLEIKRWASPVQMASGQTRSRRLLLSSLILLTWNTAGAAESAIHDLVSARKTSLDGTAYTVTRGHIQVPEIRNEDGKDERTLDLAFVRIHRDGSENAPPHFILAGGPGDSGVELARNLARRGGGALLNLLGGDLVGIDQRGSGGSRPSLELSVGYDLPLDRPGSPEIWLPIMEDVVREEAAGLRARGIRLSAYNTRESAADVNAVRRALGYDRIVLWGRSYGSHLALAVMRDYPQSIARAVLANPEGPDHTWKLPARVDAVLARLAERMQRPDLLDRMRTVLRRLREAPLTVQVTRPGQGESTSVVIGAFDIQWLTAHALADPRTLARLPAAFDHMHSGDFSGIGRLVLGMRESYGPQSAMKHLMDLTSGSSPQRRAKIRSQTNSALLGNAINFPGMALAEAWGATELDDLFRSPVSGEMPVLILAADLDARTPLDNASEIAASLPNARVIVVTNGTHRFHLFGTPELRALLSRFLAGERVAQTRVALPPPVAGGG